MFWQLSEIPQLSQVDIWNAPLQEPMSVMQVRGPNSTGRGQEDISRRFERYWNECAESGKANRPRHGLPAEREDDKCPVGPAALPCKGLDVAVNKQQPKSNWVHEKVWVGIVEFWYTNEIKSCPYNLKNTATYMYYIHCFYWKQLYSNQEGKWWCGQNTYWGGKSEEHQ